METKTENRIRPAEIIQALATTKPQAIAQLDFVKDKFIKNYNLCHKEQLGDLMYHRQMVHFNQIINGSTALQKVAPFSLYACFVTAAVNGYSLDPQDNEVYLLPMGGQAVLWPQAGAHIRRLIRTGQIVYAEQAKLVYEGDDFEVENGRVIMHKENYKSEIYRAGYVKFIIDDKGTERHFIYRKSDWEAWKKKAPTQGGNWTDGVEGQPGAAFLRTKIIKHATKEKCWSIGQTSPIADTFNVLVDEDTTQITIEATTTPSAEQGTRTSNIQEAKEISPEAKMAIATMNHHEEPTPTTLQFDDNDGLGY